MSCTRSLDTPPPWTQARVKGYIVGICFYKMPAITSIRRPCDRTEWSKVRSEKDDVKNKNKLLKRVPAGYSLLAKIREYGSRDYWIYTEDDIPARISSSNARARANPRQWGPPWASTNVVPIFYARHFSAFTCTCREEGMNPNAHTPASTPGWYLIFMAPATATWRWYFYFFQQQPFYLFWYVTYMPSLWCMCHRVIVRVTFRYNMLIGHCWYA